MIDDLPTPSLQPAFDVVAELGPLEDLGRTRAGHRRIIPIIGGTIRGLFDAEIISGGADWQLVREDGSIDIDTRYSARTQEGHHVHLRTAGVRSGSPEVLESLLRGEEVSPADYYFRVAVTIETSAPALRHLERSLFVAVARRSADGVAYTAYRVT